jgi:nucleotide-binding universal stress UspA family protein
MPLHIVVPIDGSEPSQHAIAWGIAFARRTGAVMSVCSVFDPMLSCVAAAGGAMIDLEPLLEALEADAGRYCAAAVAQAAAENVTVTSAVLEGAPAAAIDDFACARGADIVVLGTHARHGLALGILGSVTAAVVRSSRVGVVTVRAETILSETGPIVVAVDDSEASAAAATFALTIARALGTPVHLVHVALGSDAVPAALHTVARDAAAAGVVCSTEIRHGAVVDTLITAAGERGASMLATGTHGRGGLGRLLLGSVAEGLIRGAVLPVLVVRPKGVS